MSGGNQATSCTVCSKIRRSMIKAQNEAEGDDTKLGSVAELRLSDCPVHDALLAPFLHEENQPADDEEQVKLTHIGGRIVLRCAKAYLGLGVLSTPEQTGPVQLVDRSWIDATLPRRWLDGCKQWHGDRCRISAREKRLFHAFPSWLIDARHMCLSPCQPGSRYVALSYVWGKAASIKTLKSNFQQFRRDGAFLVPSVLSQIPRTIKDAIRFVESLGQRYLWVDSLCILQDDKETIQSQINDMASIYANAQVTIVVADGAHADHGLHGIQHVSDCRDYEQEVLEIGEGYELVWGPASPRPLATTIWAQRGWTYQEYQFSKRQIIFTGGSVKWSCGGGVWVENLELSQRNLAFTTPDIKLHFLPWPDFDGYRNFVRIYNSRQFTYAEDALAGCSGILSILHHVFDGGFTCGLPDMFFDVALLWQPARTLKRRTARNISATALPVPSWSWIGWQGLIAWRCNASGCDYLKSTRTPRLWSGIRTVSTVQWYNSTGPGAERRPIICTSQKYQASCLDKTKQLPAGWSRHREDPNRRSYRENFNSPPEERWPYFFTHESDPETHYWYPIPIPDQDRIPAIRSPAGLISCRTQRAWFRLGTRLSAPKTGYLPAQVHLREESGRWAGTLDLHDDLDLEEEEAGGGAPQGLEQGYVCELISISRGYDRYDSSSKQLRDMSEFGNRLRSGKERPKGRPSGGSSGSSGDGLYEFHNVLWIEWQNGTDYHAVPKHSRGVGSSGIAYRKAIGRVMKHVWERQDLEWVDVTLG